MSKSLPLIISSVAARAQETLSLDFQPQVSAAVRPASLSLE